MNKSIWKKGADYSAAVLALLLSASASAIPASTVGDLDTTLANLLGQTTLPNSGEATEEAWVSSIVGESVDLVYKNTSYSWEAVDGTSDWWAEELDSSPEWFLLKLGGGQTSDTHLLFENDGGGTNDSGLDWAVIDISILAGFTGYTNFNLGVISHTSEFCGENGCEPPCEVDCEPPCQVDCEPPCETDCTPVSEPDVALLMLLGVVGLAGQRLVKRKA